MSTTTPPGFAIPPGPKNFHRGARGRTALRANASVFATTKFQPPMAQRFTVRGIQVVISFNPHTILATVLAYVLPFVRCQ